MILACLIIGALVIGVAWATHITEADGHSAPCWDLFGVGRVISIIRAVRNGSILYYMDQFWPMYGDTYTLNIMGTKVTFTRDATNIKQVLATNWQDYNAAKGIRDALWEHLAPRTVAAVDGTEWEDARKKWRHSLVHIDQLFDIPFFEASFQKLVHRIPRQAVDVQSLFLDLGTDIVSNLVVGKSLDCIGPENQSPENRRYVEALSRANPVTAMRGFLGPLARINPEFGYKADCDIITGHVAHLVRERLSTIQERKLDGLEAVSTQQTFLERLLIHSKDTSMVNGDLVSLMMGNEEMARPLSHTIFQRSRHPEVYQKLRESIIGLVGYEPPAYEQLNMFAYLKDVLNEALRLLPPVPLTLRRANTDTWLPKGGGKDGNDSLLIRNGQRIVISIFGSHHSPTNFGSDASEFRPERWDDLNIDTPGYLPFIIGPRQCSGRQYALNAKSRDSADFAAHIELSMSNMNGVWVEMIPDSNI